MEIGYFSMVNVAGGGRVWRIYFGELRNGGVGGVTSYVTGPRAAESAAAVLLVVNLQKAALSSLAMMSDLNDSAKLAKLAALSPPTASLDPVIAVDLDDVLSQTNRMVAECQCSWSFCQIGIDDTRRVQGTMKNLAPKWTCHYFIVSAFCQ